MCGARQEVNTVFTPAPPAVVADWWGGGAAPSLCEGSCAWGELCREVRGTAVCYSRKVEAPASWIVIGMKAPPGKLLEQVEEAAGHF